MARLIRYTANRRGLDDLARSDGMDSMLAGRAQRVADVAQAQYDANPPQSGRVDVEVLQAGSDTPRRARVAVLARHPAALRIEAKRRVLGGSLDAARG